MSKFVTCSCLKNMAHSETISNFFKTVQGLIFSKNNHNRKELSKSLLFIFLIHRKLIILNIYSLKINYLVFEYNDSLVICIVSIVK